MEFYTREELREKEKSNYLLSWCWLHITGPDVENGKTDFSKYSNNQLKNLDEVFIKYNPIDVVDLEPLKICKRLKSLEISYTNTKTIDLTPLWGKPLKRLELNNNLLEEIDLKPLSSCYKLDTLILNGNFIKKIDLEPLRNLKKLGFISISGNFIEEIDLEPLRELELGWLNIRSFLPFSEINLEPLSEQNYLEYLMYSFREGKGEEIAPLIKENRRILYLIENKYYIPDKSGEINPRCTYTGAEVTFEKEWGSEIVEIEQELSIKNELTCISKLDEETYAKRKKSYIL